MIKAGQQITAADLATLAAQANAKLSGAPYRFFGNLIYFPYAGSDADFQHISDAAIGDIAFSRFAGVGYSGWILLAYPARSAANWQKISVTEIALVDRVEELISLDPPPPYAIVTAEFLTYGPDRGNLQAQLPVAVPFEGSRGDFRSHVFYRYDPATVGVAEEAGGSRNRSGWCPIGSWTDELNRLRNYLFRKLTCRGGDYTPPSPGGILPQIGLKQSCRISGPWPQTLIDNTAGLEWATDSSSIPGVAGLRLGRAPADSSGTPGPKPAIYVQRDSGQSLQAQQIVYPVLGVIGDSFRVPGVRSPITGFRIQASKPGRLVGTLWCLGNAYVFYNDTDPHDLLVKGDMHLVKSITVYPSGDPFLGADITRLEFDTIWEGGSASFFLDPGGATHTFRQGLFRSGPFFLGGNNVTGSALRFIYDYDSAPAQGLAQKPLQKIEFDEAYSPLWRGLGDDASAPTVQYYLPPLDDPFFYVRFPGDTPIFDDTAERQIDRWDHRTDFETNLGAVVMGLVPGQNPYNAMMHSYSLPPRALQNIGAYNDIFAPNRQQGEVQFVEDLDGVPLEHRLDYVTLPIYPYPAERGASGSAASSIVLPAAFAAKDFLGTITRLTVSRCPNDAGQFPTSSAALSFEIGAYGILGKPADQFTTLFRGTLNGNQNYRTWRSSEPDDSFESIPVLSNIKLAYKCRETLIVQPFFLPAQMIPWYNDVSEPFSSYSGEPYLSPPILADHYNDTLRLLETIP